MLLTSVLEHVNYFAYDYISVVGSHGSDYEAYCLFGCGLCSLADSYHDLR
jgi:hypothetical protein